MIEELPDDDAGSDDGEQWDDILGSGSLMCHRVRGPGPGESDAGAAQDGQLVTLRVVGRLQSSGLEFERHSALHYRCGDVDVVRGVDLIVRMMVVGCAWTVRVQSRLAYAEVGCAPHVPPGADVEYDLELLELGNVLLPLERMPMVLRKARAQDRKLAGNALFKGGRLSAAATCYEQAMRCLDYERGGDEEAKPPLDDAEWCALLEACANNLATVRVREGDDASARRLARAVLDVNPDSVKALVRVGTIAVAASDFDEAQRTLTRALRLRPGFPPAAQQLAVLKKKRQRHAVVERKMWKKAVGGGKAKEGGGAKAAAKKTSEAPTTGGGVAPAAADEADAASPGPAARALGGGPLLGAAAVLFFAVLIAWWLLQQSS